MKVMFVPTMGAKVPCYGSNRVVKQAGQELPKCNEGVSNEQIYNTIMTVKNSVSRIFSPHKNKAVDVLV